MTDGTPHTDGGERAIEASTTGRGRASRRSFLKATAAGAAATGIGAATVGTAAADRGIPTPWLERDGNLIVDPSGNQVILRGVNIADPKRIDVTASARGKTTEQVIDYATDPDEDWYARLIRLPVHPGDIADLPPVPESDVSVYMPPTFTQDELVEYCEQYLDPAVDACEERGVYCIVDFHRHWGTGSLQWDNPELEDEIHMFWETVAPRYADRSHVLFEMFNEPTTPGIGASPAKNDWEAGRWRDWRSHAQQWADTIRDNASNVTLIGSPDWSQYPEGALVEEFEGENFGYTYHIYPGHDVSSDGQWDEHDNGQGVEYCWEEVPLFVTEFGWEQGSASHPLPGTTEGFGEPFFEWMNDKPIHWTAWCFDPTWLSPMVERQFEVSDSTDDSIGDPYTGEIPEFCEDLPCEWEPLPDPDMGVKVQTVLKEYRNEDVPGGDDGPTSPASPGDQWTNEVTETTIEVGWEAVAAADGYVVELDGDERVDTSETSATLEDLDPGTSYEIGIAAYNDAGTSPAATTTVVTAGGDECRDFGSFTACDADDDDLYGDFTGDGELTTADVSEFQANLFGDGVQDNSDSFNFAGGDSVSHGDVIALFQDATGI